MSQFTNWLDLRSFPPTRYLQGLLERVDLTQAEKLVWNYLKNKIGSYEELENYYEDEKLALATLIEIYEQGNWLTDEQRKKLKLPEKEYGRVNPKAARAMADYKMRWM